MRISPLYASCNRRGFSFSLVKSSDLVLINTVIRELIDSRTDCVEHEGNIYVRKGAVRDRAKNSKRYRTGEVTQELNAIIEDRGELFLLKASETGAKPTEYVRLRG